MPVAEMGVKGSWTAVTGAENSRARRAVTAARRARLCLFARPADGLVGRPGDQLFLSQASTLSRLASTHFLAAASGDILSSAMYFATRFWSSLVQVKFFTRS